MKSFDFIARFFLFLAKRIETKRRGLIRVIK